MKKLAVFCFIATIVPLVDAWGDSCGVNNDVGCETEAETYIEDWSYDKLGMFIFDDKGVCENNCNTSCELFDTQGLEHVFVVCPDRWSLVEIDGKWKCVPYTEFIEEYSDDYGKYIKTYTWQISRGNANTNCSPCNAWSSWYNDDIYICRNLKVKINFCQSSLCAPQQYTEKKEIQCFEKNYYDSSTDSCLPCGSIERDGETYNLTSKNGNKDSREKACYVDNSNKYEDNRGKYTLEGNSSDMCTVEMLNIEQ